MDSIIVLKILAWALGTTATGVLIVEVLRRIKGSRSVPQPHDIPHDMRSTAQSRHSTTA